MESSGRICALPNCGMFVPKTTNGRPPKYCSKAHGNTARKRAYDLRKKAVAHAAKPKLTRNMAGIVDADGNLHPERARRGRVYDELKAHREWLDAYNDKVLTLRQLAALCQCEMPEITMALAALALDEIQERQVEQWEGPPPEAVESLEDFVAFRDRYFLTEKGVPYDTAPFHRRWIEAILATMSPGENRNRRLMILSPPRHGKTQLLLHFCIWLIVRNPHIRIVWIAGNADLAEDWIAAVEDELDNNEALKRDFLPPGKTFRPGGRSRRSWSRSQFTVDTRTLVVKSPTMIASSRGSKVLSRDADLIVADDIEDHGSTLQPGMREQTRNWWTTDVGSRKEAHTALVVIGSRQHADDLYGHLLESNAWQSIVETAHAEECTLAEDDVDAHVDCMLWPNHHPYWWLMDQLEAAETTGGRAMWEMVYLNRPTAEGLMMFNRDKVLDARDASRDLFEYPAGSVLLAGLDPSGTGYQASFLWAYHTDSRKLFMVDSENEQGGGIARARLQIANWFDQAPERRMYCRDWWVEENLFKGGITQDEILTRYCHDNMIRLNPHQTGVNKWDPNMGVSAMNSWFEAGRISLPYKTTRAQAKSDAFIRQLLNFSSNTGRGSRRRRSPTSDIVMAAWFPFPHIQTLEQTRQADMRVDYGSAYRGWTSKPMFVYDSTRKAQ